MGVYNADLLGTSNVASAELGSDAMPQFGSMSADSWVKSVRSVKLALHVFWHQLCLLFLARLWDWRVNKLTGTKISKKRASEN